MANSNKREKADLLGFPAFKQTFTNKTKIYELNNNYLKPKLLKDENGKFASDPETGLNIETDNLDYDMLLFKEERDDYLEIQKYSAGLTVAEIIAKYTDSQGNIYIQEANEALRARVKPTLQEQLGIDYLDLSKMKNNIPEMREEINKVRQELNRIINDEVVRNNNKNNKDNDIKISQGEKTPKNINQQKEKENNKGVD